MQAWLCARFFNLSAPLLIAAAPLVAVGCKEAPPEPTGTRPTAPRTAPDTPSASASAQTSPSAAPSASSAPSPTAAALTRTRKVDAARGGLFVHGIDDETAALPALDGCPAVEIREERTAPRGASVRYAYASERAKLTECLAKQPVPDGRAFAVGPARPLEGWRSYLIEREPAVRPDACTSVRMDQPGKGISRTIRVTFSGEGQKQLGDFMAARVGRRMAIVIGHDVEIAQTMLQPHAEAELMLLALGNDHASRLLDLLSGEYAGELEQGVQTFPSGS